MDRTFPHPRRHAQLVWLDPGVTTGICVLTVQPGWLQGAGEVTWEGLGKAISNAWFGQVGDKPAVVGQSGRKIAPSQGRAVKPAEHVGVSSPNPEHEMIRQLEAVLDLWPDAAWGYEDFIPRSSNADRDFLAPVRVFSTLTYVERVYGERRRDPFVQSASVAKTTATDDRLKRASLYRIGLPHATDAARHACTFLREARGDAELRRMAWPKLFPKEMS